MSEPVTHPGGEPLSEDRCWEHLATSHLGRLIVVVEGRPEVFPVNYAVGDRTVVFRTGEGDKLAELTVYPNIAFEVDHVDETLAWSVVLHGRARTLTHYDEIQRAEELDLHAWAPGEKYNFVVIEPADLTGRRFTRTPA